MKNKLKIIISQGDANGIGLEVGVKAVKKYYAAFHTDSQFTLVANRQVLREYLDKIGEKYSIAEDKLLLENCSIDLINCVTTHAVQFGQMQPEAGKLAGEAIDRAIDLTLAGDFDALLTLPINKEAMNLGGWNFTGHTEFLAAKCKAEPLMILSDCESLNVALATIHEPIEKVADMITPELCEKRINEVLRACRYDFGEKNPKIAVLALNPHAGENGMLGRQENQIINPVIHKFSGKAFGAFSADAFFCRREYKKYNAVLAMYHDQGLIPLKMLAGERGVNFTAGLPIVRTSPDHGTGFDISGSNIANCDSTFDALIFAEKVVHNRRKYDEIC